MEVNTVVATVVSSVVSTVCTKKEAQHNPMHGYSDVSPIECNGTYSVDGISASG